MGSMALLATMESSMLDRRLVFQSVSVVYDHEFRAAHPYTRLTPPIPARWPDGFTATVVGIDGASMTLMDAEGNLHRWSGDLILREISFIDPAAVVEQGKLLPFA